MRGKGWLKDTTIRGSPMKITLGPCHYDFDEHASAMAVAKDGSGWIPVCDNHKKAAEDEGYEIKDDIDTVETPESD